MTFKPNWTIHKNPDTGKLFGSSEEAMMFAVKAVLAVGGTCSWRNTFFRNPKRSDDFTFQVEPKRGKKK